MTKKLFKKKEANKSTGGSSKPDIKKKRIKKKKSVKEKIVKKALPKALKERNDKITAYCKKNDCCRKSTMIKFKGQPTSKIK